MGEWSRRFWYPVDNAKETGSSMDSNKQTIVIIVVVALLLVGFIAGPKIISTLRGNAAAGGGAKQVQEPILPPLLKEADMIGSVWNVTIQSFTLKVTFSANGQALASSDNMMVRQLAKARFGVDSLPGKWRIEGPKLLLNTNFDGKDYATELTISGTKLLSKQGVPVVRVQ